MKNLKQLYAELSDRTDFIVDLKGFDGGRGCFVNGSCKKHFLVNGAMENGICRKRTI